MPEVFISYSRDDLPRATALAAAIGYFGHKVWFDPDLVAGDDFQDVIETKLSKVDAIVVLWTETSVHKPWVVAEACFGEERGILVPVRYDKDLIPPKVLQHRHAEYLGDWNGANGASEIDKLNLRIGELKSQADRERLSNLAGPQLKAKLQDSKALAVIFDTALPGGLRVILYAMGAILTGAGLWVLLFAVNAAIGDHDNPPTIGLLLLLIAGLAVARGLDQLVQVGKHRSSIRFFDRAFSFSCVVCCLLALLAALGLVLQVHLATGSDSNNFSDMLQNSVAIAMVLLVGSYVVRIMITAGRVLNSRV